MVTDTAFAQSIESQRDKPVSNGDPQSSFGNPSMNPHSPKVDPTNPLMKKKKRGIYTDVNSIHSGTPVDNQSP